MKTIAEMASVIGTFFVFFIITYITTSIDMIAVLFWSFVGTCIASFLIISRLEEDDDKQK